MEYHGRAYYEASLAEPMSCCIGAMHACYHSEPGSYVHEMGIKKGGSMCALAAAGPMGLGLIDYALHIENHPSLLLQFSPLGYDDVFCMAPIASICELSSSILGKDGCLNFFAGPTDKQFSASLNYYNVHYNANHVIGTTGGNTDDIKESLQMSAAGLIHPSVMVTHIGGLNVAADTTLNLPKIPGGKKLIYTHIDMPLTAIEDFKSLGEKDFRFRDLYNITQAHGGLWCPEAEEYLLAHWA